MPSETDQILQFFFSYDHRPAHLQEQSDPFADVAARLVEKLLREQIEPFAYLAAHLVETLPRNPERTVALRKLLEAKDCAVRARLWKPPE